MSDQLTFLSAEPPASRSASRESDLDWTIRAATSPLSSLRWLDEFAPAGSFGRMSPASCRTMEDGRLEPSSGSWGSAGFGGPTGCLTLSMSEWTGSSGLSPSGDAVCSLSDILETESVPKRYFLSAKACVGILRRAEKRGKELPPQLHHALLAVAGASGEPEKPEGKTQSLTATTGSIAPM